MPWVPNKAQIVDAAGTATKALQTPTDSTLGEQEKARDNYFAVTGTKPRVAYANHYTAVKDDRHRLAAVARTVQAQREFNNELDRAAKLGEYRTQVKKEREMRERARRL